MATTTPTRSNDTNDTSARALSSFADGNRLSRWRKAKMVAAVLRAEAVVEPGRRPRMLDLGAGSGLLGQAVSDQLDAVCIQVDIQDERVERKLPFAEASGDDLPFPDACFDVVLANHVIEHVVDQPAVLSELRRVLKLDGVCYLSTPNRYAVIEPHYRLPLLSWLPRPWADSVVRLFGRGKRYDIEPLSHDALYRLVKDARFRATDYTVDIVSRPHAYGRRGVVASLGSIAGRIGGPVLGAISPSFVLTLRPAAVGAVVPATPARGADWVTSAWDTTRGWSRTVAKPLGSLAARVRDLASRSIAAISNAIDSPSVMSTTVFMIAVLPAFFLAWHGTGAFNSPDETATHLAAKTFAETGHFYIQDEFTLLNPESTTGPRGFVQLEDRAVPIYSLGFLFLLGIARFLFGGFAPYMLALVPGVTALGLTFLLRRLDARAPAFLALGFLAITPVWYWSSRVYSDMGMTVAFVVGAVIAHVLAYQRGSWRWFFAGSSAFAGAALVRNAEATFMLLIGLASIAAFLHAHRAADRRVVLRALGLYAGAQIAFFLAPTAILNWMTNGSPQLFGYQVLYSYYWPSLVSNNTHLLLAPFAFAYRTFFPQPTNLSVVWNGLLYQVLIAMPVLLGMGAVGLHYGWGTFRQKVGPLATTLGLVAIAYVIVSRANPGTFLALSEEPDIRASLVRYWMPVFLVVGISAIYALSRIPRSTALALVVGLAIASSYQVWVSPPESILGLRASIDLNSRHYEEILTARTETNAVIFAGARIDKWVVPVRRTAGLWSGTDIEIPHDEIMERVATAGRQAFQAGIPVYYIFGADENFEAFEDALATAHFGVDHVVSISRSVDLWRLKSLPRQLEITASSDGSYISSGFELGIGLSMTVVQDGAGENLLPNPSFELGADGWSGPDVGERVSLSGAQVLFGDQALRMELTGDEDGFLRRSFNLVDLPSSDEGWSVRAHVNVQQLDNAAAELRVFVQDGDGKNIARFTARLDEPTDGFLPLVIVGERLPAGAVRITTQLALLPTEEGGRAVVFWDAIELADDPVPASEYCDGSVNGCSWDGEPHASTSSRVGGLGDFALRGETRSVSLAEPFRQGDGLTFTSDGLFVVRDGEAVQRIDAGSALASGESVRVSFEAASAPTLAVRTKRSTTSDEEME